jgi:putative membrane protein
MYDFQHAMGGMHWFWWIAFVAAIAAAWWAFPRRPVSPHDPPLDRLKRRYSDGEITTEEYEERKTTLLRDP